MSLQTLKVYFAGSIRGGTFDGKAEAYQTIIQTIEKGGGVVISQHAAITGKAEKLTDPQIYERDMRWIAESHCLIAEITAPSIGVGYEIKTAEGLDLPILCVCHASVTPTAICSGNKLVQTDVYNDLEQLRAMVRGFLSGVMYDLADFES